MSIATKTGDDGNTGLFGGKRVPKDDERVEAYGAVDELNAMIGLVRAGSLPDEVDAMLLRIQSELFDLGAELATPREGNRHSEKIATFPSSAVEQVDRDLRLMEGRVPPLTSFILPGGHELAAFLQVCRTLCRRAERRAVTLARHEHISGIVLQYLNRLSDLFFMMAREVNSTFGVEEPEWNPRESRETESL